MISGVKIKFFTPENLFATKKHFSFAAFLHEKDK